MMKTRRREKFSKREKLGFRKTEDVKFLCFSTAWLLFRQKYFKGGVVQTPPHNNNALKEYKTKKVSEEATTNKKKRESVR